MSGVRLSPLLTIPLLVWTSLAAAQEPPPDRQLGALLGGLSGQADLEQVLLGLARAAAGPVDVRGKQIAAALAGSSDPSPLFVDAERLEVRRREGVVEIRVLRPDPQETEATWQGAPSRLLQLDRSVMWRVVDGRLVKISGVRDLGPAGPVREEPPSMRSEKYGRSIPGAGVAVSVGFADALGGSSDGERRRRGGPSAEEALEPPPPPPPEDRTAVFESTTRAGERRQMKIGTITLNGNAYPFRSGGHGNGNLPPGTYTATPHLWSRSEEGFSVGGVGWSVALNDTWDERVGRQRTLLRIHPDGGVVGTLGCIGIVGDADTQARCREDLRAELQRGGGRFTLVVR